MVLLLGYQILSYCIYNVSTISLTGWILSTLTRAPHNIYLSKMCFFLFPCYEGEWHQLNQMYHEAKFKISIRASVLVQTQDNSQNYQIQEIHQTNMSQQLWNKIWKHIMNYQISILRKLHYIEIIFHIVSCSTSISCFPEFNGWYTEKKLMIYQFTLPI